MFWSVAAHLINSKSDHDHETLEAITENADSLDRILGERILVDLKKILTGDHVDHLIYLIYDLDMVLNIDLPANANLEGFCEVSKMLKASYQSPWLFGPLFKSPDVVMKLGLRLKISKEGKTWIYL